jgi:hydrogenase maturation protease
MIIPMTTKPLIIGYGNIDRQDDGVAWHVLVKTASQLGITRRIDPDLGCEIKTSQADLLFTLQLTPEIAEIISAYPRVCFIDACAYPIPNGISMIPLEAQYQPSSMTHHMTPETCLAISQVLYQRQPEAVLLSVAAHEFGFSRSLSVQTQASIEVAADLIKNWLSAPNASLLAQVAEMQN